MLIHLTTDAHEHIIWEFLYMYMKLYHWTLILHKYIVVKRETSRIHSRF